MLPEVYETDLLCAVRTCSCQAVPRRVAALSPCCLQNALQLTVASLVCKQLESPAKTKTKQSKKNTINDVQGMKLFAIP